MLKICLAGFGKMNRGVYDACHQGPGIKVVSILEPNPQQVQGVEMFTEAQGAFSLADVIIDFSTKEACVENMSVAASMGKNCVIGTTGINEEGLKKIKDAIASSGTSGVLSGNFSVGVNVFIETARYLQEKLPSYEIEMVEVHHNQKKDAPSGTALRTLAALGKTKEQVPVHALRMGDVIGDHSVIFAGNSERIELNHRATSRKCFAQGALLSAKWVSGKHDGVLHDFRDVLNTK